MTSMSVSLTPGEKCRAEERATIHTDNTDVRNPTYGRAP